MSIKTFINNIIYGIIITIFLIGFVGLCIGSIWLLLKCTPLLFIFIIGVIIDIVCYINKIDLEKWFDE